jgi:hypothetical protein
MPCDSRRSRGQTEQERRRVIEAALARLERALGTGSARVTIGANGALAFVGWQDRDDVTDLCAYRALSAKHSWPLRQAIARAEAQQGRKVSEQAIASGLHSHDGGQTWGRH